MEQNVAAAAHDFSLIGMYMGADPIVKGVMIALGLASVICWAIILEKMIRMFILRRDLRAMESFAKSPSSVSQTRGLTRVLLSAAESEAIEGTSRGEDRSDVRARLEKAMRTALKSQLQRIEVGLPFLATVGSAAPFIGLFGTVWGIMNSFTAIAHAQDTSLATVAPGIAEALFATALGLAAAIPAVMAYNHYAVKLGRAAARAADAIGEIARQISRPADAGPIKASVEPLRAGKAV
ncbi:MAG: MotA/TolQ/ExbB proton channel family protein [Hyphomicrobium sp.]|nr:MotA/TolQ/ExbB proton channel family protein [Hyphomicrobium sp.]